MQQKKRLARLCLKKKSQLLLSGQSGAGKKKSSGPAVPEKKPIAFELVCGLGLVVADLAVYLKKTP